MDINWLGLAIVTTIMFVGLSYSYRSIFFLLLKVKVLQKRNLQLKMEKTYFQNELEKVCIELKSLLKSK